MSNIKLFVKVLTNRGNALVKGPSDAFAQISSEDTVCSNLLVFKCSALNVQCRAHLSSALCSLMKVLAKHFVSKLINMTELFDWPIKIIRLM